jgi:plasmid replication initiation protein
MNLLIDGIEAPDEKGETTKPEPSGDVGLVAVKLMRSRALKGQRGGLLPVHHPNRDFFLCDLFDYAIKDDGVSMEAPIFTLATRPDITEWKWESKDGNRAITVTPSMKGRATQFDKDILIYVVSQITEALNRGRADAEHRKVRFRVYDYLVSTNKLTGGVEYKRLEEALERLSGTRIKTNIKTGGVRVKNFFGLIESAKIVEKAPDDERMIAIEVTLSEWLFNAVQAHEVLTINPDYFRLRKPLERRLYELARKHCGDQAKFVISLELLQEKCGSKSALKEFRRTLRGIIQVDTLPDYRMLLDDEKDQVIVYQRDAKKLAKNLVKQST